MEAILLVLTGLSLLVGGIILYLILNKLRTDSSLKDALNNLKTARDAFETTLRDDVQRIRNDLSQMEAETRKELAAAITIQNETINKESRSNREETANSLTKLSQQINTDAIKNREELTKALTDLSESLSRKMQELTQAQNTQFDALKTALEVKMEQIRSNNETKLEEMRKTVDEKLHETLEKRLGESFKQVSERLELVHKGLGEMQSLANGVGDLKKVLTNVKTRGMLGELQLENLLEQILIPEQYVRNFKPYKLRDDVVEFAIRMPGIYEDQEAVYLPIDAKFPLEDFNRLVEAWDLGDITAVESARKGLQSRIIGCARTIHDRYLNPPYTTDFALLFLPVEGLYAEVLRDPELFDTVRRQFQVIVVGPTTVAAILNSLQMGFRTMAIEKRTVEVWKILSAVKSEFGKFGEVLEKTQKKLQEASNTIETASHRSRQIEKKLRKVQEIPAAEAVQILELADESETEFTEDEESEADLT